MQRRQTCGEIFLFAIWFCVKTSSYYNNFWYECSFGWLFCCLRVCLSVCVCARIIWLSWPVISIHSLAYVRIHKDKRLYTLSYSAYGKALNVIICYINKYQFYNHNVGKCVTVPRCRCALLLLFVALSFFFVSFDCFYLVCVYMVARLVTQDTYTKSDVWVAHRIVLVLLRMTILSLKQTKKKPSKECFEMILINIKTMHFFSLLIVFVLMPRILYNLCRGFSNLDKKTMHTLYLNYILLFRLSHALHTRTHTNTNTLTARCGIL